MDWLLNWAYDMAKKLSPSAQKLKDELIRLSKTTKVRPKQVNLSDVFQFNQEEVIKRTEKQFKDAPKSEGEMGMEGCLIRPKKLNKP